MSTREYEPRPRYFGCGLLIIIIMKLFWAAVVVLSLVAAPVLGSNARRGTLGSCSLIDIDLTIPSGCKDLWSRLVAAITTGTETLKEVATQLCNPVCGRFAYDTIRRCSPSSTNILTILDQVCATNVYGTKCDAIYGNYTLTQLLDYGLPCYFSTQAGQCDPSCAQNLITISNEWGCCLDVYGTAFANKSAEFVLFWRTCNLIFPATCVGAFSSQATATATGALVGIVILLLAMVALD